MRIAIFENDTEIVEYLYNLFYQIGTDKARDYAIDNLWKLYDQNRLKEI